MATKVGTSLGLTDSRIVLLLSTSLVPLWAFNKLRWTSRLGIDQLHLVLLQLLFVLLLSHKFKPSSKSPVATTRGSSKAAADGQSDVPCPTSPRSAAARTAARLRDMLEQASDWNPVFPTPGLDVLRHRANGAVYAIRMELEEGMVTADQLVRCLSERKRWEWDRMCECGEDLGEGVSWVRMKAFWPIKPKELVLHSSIYRLPPPATVPTAQAKDAPLRIVVASTSTTHPLKQATLNVDLAGYLIEQLPSSALRVTQLVDLSGFGPLPTFVTKAILTKFVPSSFRKLVALAQLIPPHPGGHAWLPPPLDASPAGTDALPPPADEQERLRAMIVELKQVIGALRLHQSSSPWWRQPKTIVGLASLLVGLSVLPKVPLLRRRQVRWLYSQI